MKKVFLNILLLIIPLIAFSQDCNNINITTNNNSISIDGLNAPVVQVQVFDLQNSWYLVLNCADDCNTPTETVTDLALGDYLVKVTYYDANWTLICIEEIEVTITGNICDNQGGDSDSDGVCDDLDCQPNNPLYPATPGFTCDDGDDSTNNDVVTADGCDCQGDNNPGPPNCNTIGIVTGNGSITVTGLIAPVVGIRLIDLATQEFVYTCIDNCTLPTTNITGLETGDYQLRVIFAENNGSDSNPLDGTPICGVIENLTVINSGEVINLNCPADILLDPIPGNLVTFTWPTPTGSTSCSSGGLTITQIGGPTLGTQLLANNSTYEITYEATDDCGNSTQCTFNITEQFFIADIEFSSCPSDINVSTSSVSGVLVTWDDPVLETNCPDGASIIQSTGLPNGSVFPIGTTEVVFQGIGNGVGNGCGVGTVCVFNVTVSDSNCPDNDNDGICNDEDCQPNNSNFPAIPGSDCNDGNPLTSDDIISPDGCGCSGTSTGEGIDLVLNITGDGSDIAAYENFSIDVTVSNEGNQSASNVIVNVPQPQNVVFQGGNSYSTNQGNFDEYSTFNWNVGTLTSGQSATITFNYFSLVGAPYTIYGQIQSMSGTDIDSTPGNGIYPTPNEDDEALYVTGSGTPGGENPDTCPLNLITNVSNIVCNDNGTPNNDTDDTFTFDLVVNSAGLWGWTGNGQSGIYGQVESFGPYNISAGTISFAVVDNDNPSCTANVYVNPPNTCSNNDEGGPNPIDDCTNISVTSSGYDIILSGLDAEQLTAVWIFDLNNSWDLVFDCSYECNATETVSVDSGSYQVVIKRMMSDWTVICEISETISINPFTNEEAELRNENSLLNKVNSDFMVYPNPSSDFINISLNTEFAKSINVNLTDKLGRLVYSKNTSIKALNNQLNLSQFEAGVYFLTIQIDNNTPVTKQVVLMK